MAAAPGVDAVLRDVATRSCITLTITRTPAAQGLGLLRAGKVDAWIPDSRQYGYAAGARTAATAPAVAWSPIVMAGQPATVGKVTTPSWAALIPGQGTVDTIPVGMQSYSSGTSLALAGALTSTAQPSVGGDKYLALAAAAGAITRMAPATDGSAVQASGLRAMERRLTRGLGIVPTAEGVPVLQAPWISGARLSAASTATSRTLLAALQGAAGRQARAAHGYLDPGTAAVTIAGKSIKTISTIDMSLMAGLFGVTGSGLRPGNTLAVLDVSGSMGDAPAGRQTPMEGVKASARCCCPH